MLISIAEALFVIVIGFLAAAFAYYGWIFLVPKLPFKIPPVLFAIFVGCTMRLLCKPLLESPSADAYAYDEAANMLPGGGGTNSNQNLDSSVRDNPHHHHQHQHEQKAANQLHLYSEGVVRTISSPAISICLASVGILIGSHIDVPFLQKHTRALLSLTICCALGAYLSVVAISYLIWPSGSVAFPFIHLVAATAMERSSGEALATITDLRALHSPYSSTVFFAKSTIFIGAAMDVGAVVVFVLSLAMMQAGTGLWHSLEIFFGTLVLVLAVLGIGKVHAVTTSTSSISQTSSSSSSSQNYSFPFFSNLNINFNFLGNLFEKIPTNSFISKHFTLLNFHERSAIITISLLVIGNYLIPPAELLLAAVAVGMRLAYLKVTNQVSPLPPLSSAAVASSSSTAEKDHLAVVDNIDKDSDMDNVGGGNNNNDNDNSNIDMNEPSTPSKRSATHSSTLAPSSSSTAQLDSQHCHPVVAVIDYHSTLVYSVLFAIIGLRLDAAQLISTLIESPKVSFLLFLSRLIGLVLGGAVGAILGGSRTHWKWRGFSLVTRIAVSIILLQKMEDSILEAKNVVHGAIGAVLLDMVAGPALLQFAVRRAELESAANFEAEE